MSQTTGETVRQVIYLAAAAILGSSTFLHAIEYEDRYVNGQLFFTGSEDGLEVWASVSQASDLKVMLYLVNATNARITFDPRALQVEAIDAKDNRGQRVRLQTYSAEEYERKVQRRQTWASVIYAVGQSMGSQPQTRVSSTSGTYSGSGPDGRSSGSFQAMTTTRDYAAEQAQRKAEFGSFASNLDESFKAMQGTLLRIHTLMPNTFLGGVVYIKKVNAINFEMTLPFGGKEFSFPFHFDEGKSGPDTDSDAESEKITHTPSAAQEISPTKDPALKKQLEQQILSTQKALEGDPSNAWLYFSLGRLYAISGDSTKMELAFSGSLKLSDRYRGDVEEERRSFRAVDNETDPSLSTVADTASSNPPSITFGTPRIDPSVDPAFRRQLEQQIAATQKAIETDRSNAWLYFSLGKLYALAKDETEMEKAFSASLQCSNSYLPDIEEQRRKFKE